MSAKSKPASATLRLRGPLLTQETGDRVQWTAAGSSWCCDAARLADMQTHNTHSSFTEPFHEKQDTHGPTQSPLSNIWSRHRPYTSRERSPVSTSCHPLQSRWSCSSSLTKWPLAALAACLRLAAAD